MTLLVPNKNITSPLTISKVEECCRAMEGSVIQC